jgi:hypothetical protein
MDIYCFIGFWLASYICELFVTSNISSHFSSHISNKPIRFEEIKINNKEKTWYTENRSAKFSLKYVIS